VFLVLRRFRIQTGRSAGAIKGSIDSFLCPGDKADVADGSEKGEKGEKVDQALVSLCTFASLRFCVENSFLIRRYSDTSLTTGGGRAALIIGRITEKRSFSANRAA